jgi:hypothetical protein
MQSKPACSGWKLSDQLPEWADMVINDSGELTPYGFTWGPCEVTRLSWIPGRGRTLEISIKGRPRREGLQVYISDGGRSIRVWKNGKELK